MKSKLHQLMIAAPLAAASLLGGAISAEAADLTGPGEFSFSGSVRIFLSPEEQSATGLATSFDFIPPTNGTIGADPPNDNTQPDGDGEFAIGFLEDPSEAGGFAEFIPAETDFPADRGEIGSGIAQDVTLFGTGSISDGMSGTLASLPEFLVLESNGDGMTELGGTGDWSFRAESFAEPAFETIPDPVDDVDDLLGIIQVGGVWVSPDGEDVLPGSGVFTTQFEDVTEEEVFDFFLDGGVLTTTYSATFNAVEQVPEPTSMVGLACALGLGAFSLKKKKKPANLA